MLPWFASGFALGIYFSSLGVWWWPLTASLLLGWRPSKALPLGAGVFLGAVVLWLHQKEPSSLSLAAQGGPLDISVEGQIFSGPSPAFAADGTERRKIDLWVTKIGPAPGAEGEWREVFGGLRVTLEDSQQGLALGDYARLWVTLSPLPSPQNPHEVDHRARLTHQGIDAVAYCRSLVTIGESQATGVNWARAKVLQQIERDLSGETRAVIGALVLGEPGSLPPELRARFAATGTAHLLAVSGGHVVIVTLLLEWLLRFFWLRSSWLSRRWVPARAIALLTLPWVALYVWFVGASPSALRAGLAMGAFLFCRALGRSMSGASLISLSALLALSIEPYELFGPSLQLSFAAVIGLALFTPKLKGMLSSSGIPSWADKERGFASDLAGSDAYPPNSPRRPPATPTKEKEGLGWWLWKQLKELLIATISATLATSPIVAWHFGQAAPASLWANLLMVPVVSFLLLPIGLLAAVLALLGLETLSELLFSLSAWLWSWMQELLFWVSPERPLSLPLSSLSVLFCYALLLSVFFLSGRRRLLVCLVLISCWGALAWYSGKKREGVLTVTFLSIGQGDSAILELPEGGTIVIDGGGAATGHDDPGARSIVPFLRWMGVRSIDLLVLSHPHPDHFGGLATVAEEIEVKEFWYNGGDSPDERYQRLLEATQEAARSPKDGGDPYTGFTTHLGGVSLTLLGPAQNDIARPHEDENDNSLVFLLQYQNKKILFTGDAEAAEEEAMLESGISLKADVLKLGHHGSKTSTTEEFLSAVSPSLAVACLGKKNRYGFPHAEVTERLTRHKIPLWRTDEGAVILQTNGEWLTIKQSQPRTFWRELWPFGD